MSTVRMLITIKSTLKKAARSEEHTSELQSQSNLVCRLLLEKKKTILDGFPSDQKPPVVALSVVGLVSLTLVSAALVVLLDLPLTGWMVRTLLRHSHRMYLEA